MQQEEKIQAYDFYKKKHKPYQLTLKGLGGVVVFSIQPLFYSYLKEEKK